MVDLALVFPQEAGWVRSGRTCAGAGMALVWCCSSWRHYLYNFHNPTAYMLNWRSIYILAALSVIFFAGMLLLPAFCRQVAGGAPAGRGHPDRDAGGI